MSLRAITLWQPWASLMADGVKWVETRPNRYPWDGAIGEMLAIHAAVRRSPVQRVGDWHVYGDRSGEFMTDRTERGLATGTIHPLPWGAVLAVGRLTAVVPMVDLWPSPGSHPDGCCYIGTRFAMTLWKNGGELGDRVSDQRPYGDFQQGRSALIFEDVVRLPEPLPARGRQGLWTWKGAD